MKRRSEIALKPNEARARAALRRRRFEKFGVEALILYGSVVRGEADEESDLDVLVLTDRPLSRRERHEVTEAVFEINLRHDTNISTLVVPRAEWEEGQLSVLPIHHEITKDGVVL